MIVTPKSLEPYKAFVPTEVFAETKNDDDETILQRPLNFDQFFEKCEQRLAFILKEFKKDKKFSDLLFEVCKNEIHETFL